MTNTGKNNPKTIAILSTGDMGSGVGGALRHHGFDVISALDGRSERSRGLAEAAGIRDVGSIAQVVSGADLILSILPPANAIDLAAEVAQAMAEQPKAPAFCDCNAISPATVSQIADIMAKTSAVMIDGGIIGRAPGKGPATRFYVSGSDVSAMQALDGAGIAVKTVGPDIGQASALKMSYAALTKGQFTLFTAVLMAAEVMGLSEALREELQFSQADMLQHMEAMVPRLPADAGRWIGEMEEIAATFEAAGVTPKFHQAAAEIFTLLARTPYASETRETFDANRGLAESVKTYAAYLRQD